jgi:hypothetical protein
MQNIETVLETPNELVVFHGTEENQSNSEFVKQGDPQSQAQANRMNDPESTNSVAIDQAPSNSTLTQDMPNRQSSRQTHHSSDGGTPFLPIPYDPPGFYDEGKFLFLYKGLEQGLSSLYTIFRSS